MGKSAKNIEPSSTRAASSQEGLPDLDGDTKVPPRAIEAIAALKNRLVKLQQPTQSGHRLFRLSYSILTLETCLEERGLTDVKLDRSPGIQAMIRRMDEELNVLGNRASVRPLVAVNIHAQNLADSGLPVVHETLSRLSDQIGELQTKVDSRLDATEIIRLLSELQKNMALDGRRQHSSQLALHAAIERLSERMTHIETSNTRHGPAKTMEHETVQNEADALQAKERIDPRPMLAAARAAAARALADIGSQPDPVGQPAPTRTVSPLPRRRWGLAFAAA